jgi:outer membrane protein OmpA-like peptidoglycan-associated protein
MSPLRFVSLGAFALLLTACATDRTTVTRDQIVATAPVCQDMTLPIYFDTGSTELTTAAAQALRESAALTRQCAVREILVVGLADADGSRNRNMELSRRRAERVAAALAAEGLPAPAFDLAAAGEAGAVNPTGAPEPLRRRAEVVIRLSPPQPSATKG